MGRSASKQRESIPVSSLYIVPQLAPKHHFGPENGDTVANHLVGYGKATVPDSTE